MFVKIKGKIVNDKALRVMEDVEIVTLKRSAIIKKILSLGCYEPTHKDIAHIDVLPGRYRIDGSLTIEITEQDSQQALRTWKYEPNVYMYKFEVDCGDTIVYGFPICIDDQHLDGNLSVVAEFSVDDIKQCRRGPIWQRH